MESRQGRLFWYALHVKPRFERVVVRNLKAKGFEEFLPLYRRPSAGGLKEIELPLVPGYVFCRFDIDDRLPILLVPGVTSVVGIGKSPTAIDEREIEDLLAVSKSGVPHQPWPHASVGQRVSVEHGALKGLEGILETVKNEHRLIISVSLLQRSVAIEIHREWVKPVDSTRPTATETRVAKGRHQVS